MKICEQWLRSWFNPACGIQALTERLTQLGLEVDEVLPAAPNFSGVVVGQVLATELHPDADKLKICTVAVGGVAPLHIVCGAPNVKEGMWVAVATVGAQLPGGLTLGAVKLRGVASAGMLCSAKELGLGDKSAGIMALTQPAVLGQNLRDHLSLDDQVITLELTPNRGDCVSLLGTARELAAAFDGAVQWPAVPDVAVHEDLEPMKVHVAPAQACLAYRTQTVSGVSVAAHLPSPMVERLRRCGMHSVNSVVDAVNYVMLELGQPMHVFDAACLQGPLQVRPAKEGETLTLLNGQLIELDSSDWVIADQMQVHALAGIMGGQGSQVTQATSKVVLESACFDPVTIRLSAARHKLQTDASYRFERGVDPEIGSLALERASAYLAAYLTGVPGPMTTHYHAPPASPVVVLRKKRIERLLGVAFPEAQVEDYLRRLTFGVAAHKEGWSVHVPSHRFDCTLEVDLIEELARLFGYDSLPSEPLKGVLNAPQLEGSVAESYLCFSQRHLLVSRGYQEIMAYSFTDPSLAKKLSPHVPLLRLKNPMSEQLSVMRNQLWPGLIAAALYNQNRQQDRLRLFELGQCFQAEGETVQTTRLAGLVMGSCHPEQWAQAKRPVDFYDIKADVEVLLGTWLDEPLRWEPSDHEALHPGRSADVYWHDRCVAQVGALHPQLQETLGLHVPVYLFEITINNLPLPVAPCYQALSKFPAVRRDLAIVLDQKIAAQAVIDSIYSSVPEHLRQVRIFDVYTGPHVPEGKKSLAVGLTFQNSSRTLREEDINQWLQGVVTDLQLNLSAELRA